MWGSSPASTTMQSVVTANSYEVSVDNTIGTKCLSIDLDDNINISINSGGNNGTFWGTGASINWRGYQAQSGTYTLTAKNGCTLSSVTFTFSISNGGTLNTNSNGNNIAAGYRLVSGTALSLSGTSKTLYVGNTNSTGSNLGKGQVRITAISVSYSAGVSCSTNPTAGSASLNGSISLSSFPVQTTGWTVGENCAWTDFGFVWSSTVSTPTLEAGGTASSGCTKIQKANSGTSTSATHSITGSFSTGNSYYVRGYGKNGYASGSYQYTSVLTITPRSVTFDLNGHGSSAPSTQYINNGDKATDPSYSESVTGWTFGGWYKEAGCSNAWTFGTDVVSGDNKTLYAKWTAKTTTVSFNQNSGTGGQTSGKTATYGSAMPTPITCPTRTGYTFGGYYDGTGGTGTQYYTNTGASARNWDKDAATATLYAKWTAKSFTVTWMVNGVAYTTGDPSNSVDFGSHVSKLPTAPTPPCGDKFMGWTTTNIGAVGLTDADDISDLNLFTTAGDAPVINAEGAVTYYAVFADYDD